MHSLFKPGARVAIGAAVALCALIGCGRSAPKLEPVEGKVTFLGAPVPEAVVVFENPAAGIYLTADTMTDGQYRIATMEGAGLPEGEYRISIIPAEVQIEIGKPLPPPKEYPNIPDRYRHPETSGFSRKVQQGENRFDFEMRP